MRCFTFITVVLAALTPFRAVAVELPDEAQKMLNDLGAPHVQQKNNGKKFTCIYGGTKQITISPLGNATVFSGEYNNCREPRSIRDGYFEVIVQDGELVGESYKRSINGDLHEAVRNGDITKTKELIRKKADVNYTEVLENPGAAAVDGWTPLMSAVLTNNFNMVKLLVSSGARVNHLNSYVVNAFWLAADSGNMEIIKYLAKQGAYIENGNNEDVTPLMKAAMNGHFQVVSYLIGLKADMNKVHKDGDSALMFALANRHSDVARLLVDSGADVNIQNKYGVTALIIAAVEGNEELVRLLVGKRADLSAKTESGKTAFDVAISRGFGSIAAFLKSVPK
jgi:ankyrin repeat protein